MFPLWGLFQAVGGDGASWPVLGVGGVLAGVVYKFYRDDRKSSEDRYALLAKESQERYAALAENYRQIVEANTKAITELAGSITTDNAVTLRLLLRALDTGKRVNIEPEVQTKGGAG
jgi:hypothetical protein